MNTAPSTQIAQNCISAQAPIPAQALDPAKASDPDQAAILLSAAGCSKVFKGNLYAFKDIDLSLRRNEIVALVGPSGCGKSTLLRVLAGLTPPSAGSLQALGRSHTAPHGKIGMLFQNPTLLQWKTAMENVLLPTRLKGLAEAGDENNARQLLNMVGLVGFEDSYPRHLSGGMQQRVALARLLNTGAEIYLLDEPFSAVDAMTRERLNVQLLDIAANYSKTILLVTHNVLEAVFMADRILIMSPHPGQIIDELPVTLARPRTLAIIKDRRYIDLVTEIRGKLD